MPEIKLNVIKPSVNNMTARVFMRAAGLDFNETDVFGQTRTPEYLAKAPSHLTPMIEMRDLPMGALWESCAIMQYLCNKNGLDDLYPKDPEARAMIDSAMFYLIGTFYPYLARATYPALNFPQYPGEVGYSDADPVAKEHARMAATEALAEPLEVFHRFFIGNRSFIGGAKPSIADIRLAATLEFLAVIDYPLPDWAKTYMASMEEALGSAYSEPAADVRSYISYVRGQR
ncbi:glutathione S-transferase family protein [Sinorhizobium terangae]|uniref:Glutathione S-transferase family protein n=1 Tax=Sinorhizobium terangae TaxID=110322 RepID=A0A6N7LIC8_SINTE|nr:glutathione S-transferase family protein [Sinorhizobium terangae]MBB4185671.1 glutathione S-transferase [Sinorhizobium terangae]MQX17537.1 glutathione S-transferase family protein [Sinorhizobium terangae]WFU46272.1 glutathione S-transferase family protein [Sinorhizobium terangae]